MWQAEHGKRDFKAAHLMAFARALDVSVSDLFRAVDLPPADDDLTPRERLDRVRASRPIVV